MPDAPWLSIIGLGEDGLSGLTDASRTALAEAAIVMGPARHLSLVSQTSARRITWPVPFADGLAVLDDLRGQKVVVLASGDPFWFGAGTLLAKRYQPGEWRAFPGPSTFALVAARLGWALDLTLCTGLHAAPITRLRPVLAPGVRLIALLRDGPAVSELAVYLSDMGFAASALTVFEAVGGPNERRTDTTVSALDDPGFAHPVCIAVHVKGEGRVVPLASGRPDDLFTSDGQMTKRPVRALTLSALTPRPYEHLWDIGGGSGSIAIEWLLSHPTLSATSFEPRADRADRIRGNAQRLGVDHLTVIHGAAPLALSQAAPADVVFVGGGLDATLLAHLFTQLSKGTRLVTNAVTLESQALVTQAQSEKGGTLLRIDLAQDAPLGSKRGWKASYPIVQWSVTL